IERVLFVATRARPADIFGDHLTDSRAAGRLVDQILAKRRGGNIRYVLMLSQRAHLVFCQSPHRKAVLQRNHPPSSPASPPPCPPPLRGGPSNPSSGPSPLDRLADANGKRRA